MTFLGLLGEVGAYLPGQTAHALSQAQANANALDVAPAAGVMTTYALAFLWLGLVVIRRRDVVV